MSDSVTETASKVLSPERVRKQVLATAKTFIARVYQVGDILGKLRDKLNRFDEDPKSLTKSAPTTLVRQLRMASMWNASSLLNTFVALWFVYVTISALTSYDFILPPF